MSVMGTGVASSDPGNWQTWIGHAKTPDVMCRVSELGPDLMLKVLEDALSPLVHGLFLSVGRQLARWQEWLPKLRQEYGVTVSDEAFNVFVANNPAPVWLKNKLTTVVLVLRAPSATKEFQ